jgi:CHRD domain
MRMVRRLFAVLVLAAALVSLAAAPAQATGGSSPHCLSFTKLTPENEVRPPDTPDPVESRANGFTLIHIRGDTLRVVTVIFNPARETFVAGHIHIGPVGVNGGIVVHLFAGSSNSLVFAHSDTHPIDEQTASDICGNLAGYYVNYHTTQDPQGAVRGQLR